MTGVHIISSSHSMFEKTIESECIFLKYFFFFFRRKLIFNFHLIFFQPFHYTFLYDSKFVLVFVRVLQQFFFPFSSFFMRVLLRSFNSCFEIVFFFSLHKLTQSFVVSGCCQWKYVCVFVCFDFLFIYFLCTIFSMFEELRHFAILISIFYYCIFFIKTSRGNWGSGEKERNSSLKKVLLNIIRQSVVLILKYFNWIICCFHIF